MDKLTQLDLKGYQPLSEVIGTALRDAIISGELKPGERLMEIHYAKKLGVSRTPFREAIHKLEQEGLVIVLPRRGAQVSHLSEKDIIDVLEIRASLDSLAAQLAAQRIELQDLQELEAIAMEFNENTETGDIQPLIASDVRFHEVIYKAAGNSRLLSIHTGLKDQIHRFRVLYLKDYSSPKSLAEEHMQILNAIKQGNAQDAYELSHKHIRHQEEVILSSMKQ